MSTYFLQHTTHAVLLLGSLYAVYRWSQGAPTWTLALASFLGAQAFAATAVHLVFDTWPEQIAKPIAREVLNVLTVRRTDLLSYGVVLAAYFASNGIEALRTSLNRAYRVSETRGIIYRRVQSIIFVLIATAGFLAISVLLVFAPLLARLAEAHIEGIKPYMGTITLWRYVIASAVIVGGLFAVHFWLPAGKRRFGQHLGRFLEARGRDEAGALHRGLGDAQ